MFELTNERCAQAHELQRSSGWTWKEVIKHLSWPVRPKQLRQRMYHWRKRGCPGLNPGADTPVTPATITPPSAHSRTPPPSGPRLRPGEVRDQVTSDGVRVLEVGAFANAEQMMADLGVDPAEWDARAFRANYWWTWMKDGDKNPVNVRNGQSRLDLAPRPRWAQMEPLEPGPWMPPIPGDPTPLADAERVLLVPDLQIGFKRHRDGSLEPIHDRVAIGTLFALLGVADFDLIIFAGDNLDGAEVGRWKKQMSDLGTFEPAMHELHFIFETVRRLQPKAAIHWTEGNHDDPRLEYQLAEVAPAMADLRPVGQDERVFSLRHLMGLDKLGVQTHGPYATPEGVLTLWDGRPCVADFHHGELVGKGGLNTAAKAFAAYPCSTAQGHTHRACLAFETKWMAGRPRLKFYLNAGALVRMKGPLPPKRARPNHQQALGTIARFGDEVFPLVHIVQGGRLLWHDALLQGADYTAELAGRWPRYGYDRDWRRGPQLHGRSAV